MRVVVAPPIGQVTSFAECAQASIFVAILEKMQEVQISGVIRKPESYEDRVHNCHNGALPLSILAPCSLPVLVQTHPLLHGEGGLDGICM